MNAPGEASTLHQQALDWLFARLAGNSPDPLPADAPPEATPTPGPDLAAEPAPPPPIASADDLQAGAEWLLRERRRLEAYTRAQLARIQQEHQAVLQQNYLNEQSLIMRSQELARREEMLQAQGRAVQEQAGELSEREQALAGQLQQWWQANEQLAALEEVSEEARQRAASQKGLLEALQSETAALQLAREAARVELDMLLQSARDQEQARAREEAALVDRKAQLEQRLYAAEKAALASDQRQAELDDLEARLRREIEEQEADLRRRAADLEARERQLRLAHTGDQAKARALQAQLEHRVAAYDRAEAALGQRQAELDELHQHLERVQADLQQQFDELDHREGQLRLREQQLREEQELDDWDRRSQRPPAELTGAPGQPHSRRLRS